MLIELFPGQIISEPQQKSGTQKNILAYAHQKKVKGRYQKKNLLGLLLIGFLGIGRFSFAEVISNWAPPPESLSSDNSADEMEADNARQDEVGEDEIQYALDQTLQMPLTVEESSRYTLGPTDVIEVKVERHPEVSGQFVINNEGKIQYEFVGDLKVEGLTKDQTKLFIEEKLSDYIIEPDVLVKIAGYNSKIVFVVGEVGKPGKIFMQGDTITVREALLQAGLPLLSAATQKTRLITPSADGKPGLKKVDVNKLLYEGDLRENLVMKPGDTLYLPPTIWAKALRVIQPVAAPIGTAAGTGRTVTTGF